MSSSGATFCGLPNKNYEPLYQPKALFGVVNVNGQAIALFRICLALLALHDILFEALPYWGFLYSQYGVLTAQEAPNFLARAFFSYSDNPFYQSGLLTVYILGLLGLLFGFRSRMCAFVCFLLFSALMERNLETVSNIDRLLGCLFLWACFLPLDRYWSIAAALRDEEVRTRPWPVIPILAAKLQIIIIYLNAGLFKLTGEPWTSGHALKYVASDKIFGSYEAAQLFNMLPDGLLKIMTWSVIGFQIGFSFLAYMPWKRDFFRAVALIGAILMHLGFIIFMQVHQFPYLCFVYLLLLIPDHWIDRLLQKRRERFAKIRIYYDPDCGFCRAVALIFREFCLGPVTPVRPADTYPDALALLKQYNSWVVYGDDDKVYLKWHGVSYILKQSPVFWIFGFITGLFFMKKPMESVYDAIGDNRNFLGRGSAFFLNPLPEIYPEKIAQIACLVLIMIAFGLTTWAIPQFHFRVPPQLEKAAREASILQWWDIFAPDVASENYYLSVYALDQRGLTLDLNKYQSPHFHMHNGYYIFNSHRVLSFYRRMMRENQNRNRMGYARYLCRMTRLDGKPAEKIVFKVAYQHTYEPERKDEFSNSFSCPEFVRP